MWSRVARASRTASRVVARPPRANIRCYSSGNPGTSSSSPVKITLGVALGLLGAETVYLLSSGKGDDAKKKLKELEQKKPAEIVSEVKSAVSETGADIKKQASEKLAEANKNAEQSVAALNEKASEQLAAAQDAASAVAAAVDEKIAVVSDAASEAADNASAAFAQSLAELEDAVAQLESKFDNITDPEKLKEAVREVEAKFDTAVDEVVEGAKALTGEEKKTEAEAKPESEEGHEAAAYNPETGEINWDCPCLGGMAHGPCGEEFKEAFACFVYSESEPKGMDCIEKFEVMRTCFRKYPEVYREQLYEDDDEPEPPVEKKETPASAESS